MLDLEITDAHVEQFREDGFIVFKKFLDMSEVEAVRERFEAVWNDDALRSHQEASARLHQIKDRTFALLRERMAAGIPTTEFDGRA